MHRCRTLLIVVVCVLSHHYAWVSSGNQIVNPDTDDDSSNIQPYSPDDDLDDVAEGAPKRVLFLGALVGLASSIFAPIVNTVASAIGLGPYDDPPPPPPPPPPLPQVEAPPAPAPLEPYRARREWRYRGYDSRNDSGYDSSDNSGSDREDWKRKRLYRRRKYKSRRKPKRYRRNDTETDDSDEESQDEDNTEEGDESKDNDDPIIDSSE